MLMRDSFGRSICTCMKFGMRPGALSYHLPSNGISLYFFFSSLITSKVVLVLMRTLHFQPSATRRKTTIESTGRNDDIISAFKAWSIDSSRATIKARIEAAKHIRSIRTRSIPIAMKRRQCHLPTTMGVPLRASGTFTSGTFGSTWERPTPIREIQTSIARALKAQYEPPQFVPEPLAKLLSQLVRGEGEG